MRAGTALEPSSLSSSTRERHAEGRAGAGMRAPDRLARRLRRGAGLLGQRPAAEGVAHEPVGDGLRPPIPRAWATSSSWRRRRQPAGRRAPPGARRARAAGFRRRRATIARPEYSGLRSRGCSAQGAERRHMGAARRGRGGTIAYDDAAGGPARRGGNGPSRRWAPPSLSTGAEERCATPASPCPASSTVTTSTRSTSVSPAASFSKSPTMAPGSPSHAVTALTSWFPADHPPAAATSSRSASASRRSRPCCSAPARSTGARLASR